MWLAQIKGDGIYRDRYLLSIRLIGHTVKMSNYVIVCKLNKLHKNK